MCSVACRDCQAGGGEKTGPVEDTGERGNDAAPNHGPHGRQRVGLPGRHDREPLPPSAGKRVEHFRFFYQELVVG